MAASSSARWDSFPALESCAQLLFITETPFKNFLFFQICLLKNHFSQKPFYLSQSSQGAMSLSPTHGGVRGGPPMGGAHPAFAGNVFFLRNLYSRTMVVPHLEHFRVLQGTPRPWELLLPHLGQTQFPPAPMPTPPPMPLPDPSPPPEPFPAGPVPSLLGITPPIL